MSHHRRNSTSGKLSSSERVRDVNLQWLTHKIRLNMIAIRIHAPAFRFHYDLSVRIPRDDILCWVEAHTHQTNGTLLAAACCCLGLHTAWAIAHTLHINTPNMKQIETGPLYFFYAAATWIGFWTESTVANMLLFTQRQIEREREGEVVVRIEQFRCGTERVIQDTDLFYHRNITLVLLGVVVVSCISYALWRFSFISAVRYSFSARGKKTKIPPCSIHVQRKKRAPDRMCCQKKLKKNNNNSNNTTKSETKPFPNSTAKLKSNMKSKYRGYDYRRTFYAIDG